jgi:hypothetical protein
VVPFLQNKIEMEELCTGWGCRSYENPSKSKEVCTRMMMMMMIIIGPYEQITLIIIIMKHTRG